MAYSYIRDNMQRDLKLMMLHVNRHEWIHLGFWETAHLPLPYANINTYFSLWAK